MKSENKLSKREIELLAKLRAGSVLCCEVVRAEGSTANDGRQWFLEPGGKRIGPKTPVRLIKKGLVSPNTPGLFHAFDSQTYEARA